MDMNWKPKRLRREVPSREDEDGLGMHELDAQQFLYDLNFREIRQPLPDFHKILTDTRRKQTQSAEGKLGVNTPILKDFFNELSKNTTLNAKDSHPEREEQTEADEIMNLPLIDRPSTILTKGQHTRFKQLLVAYDGKFPKKVPGVAESKAQMLKRREFKTLCELFRQERQLYSEALQKFYADNAQQFHLGFKIKCASSEFNGIKSVYIDYMKAKWREYSSRSSRFGQCVQTVSVRKSDVGSSSNNFLDKFAPKIVFRASSGEIPSISTTDLDSKIGSRVEYVPHKGNMFSSSILCTDEKAKSLAVEHCVDLVVTDRVISSLLKDARWTLPISYENCGTGKAARSIAFVEDPLPVSSPARDCLTFGIEEAIYQKCHHGRESVPIEYIYTLLTMEKFGKPFQVLVRSSCLMLCETNEPLYISTNLEYFPKRGFEKTPVEERASWIMRSLIVQDSRNFLFRVDPSTAEILNIKEISTADAITSDDEVKIESDLDTLGPFKNGEFASIDQCLESLVQILYSCLKLQQGHENRYIMCYPGNDGGDAISSSTLASVHQLSVSENSQIDIMNEFEVSRQVVLAPSFREWKWVHDRCAYTFPFPHDK
ncbi:hypothetical protein CTEN210_01385 [Chaetoceros tenuissimus]|uniref:Little elongation complex subunit 2 C-terminal domain-containing protein n=1 Tax=Chaetoceros tenuissimus TaxID=426638 RepID=A0AAD3GZN6_9STRA|nr:hypothetical protein CTEN210_01385 [Chaetoceros tenuissimus]